jgi:transposase InsO family protein
MRDAKLVRSTSRKGCSPDNAACEGFFGRLKMEMFYLLDWASYDR